MVGVHIAGGSPPLNSHSLDAPGTHQRLQVRILQARLGPEVIVDPPRLGNPQCSHSLLHPYGCERVWRQRGCGLAQCRCHPLAQVVDAVKVVTARDHQLAQSKQGLQPTLFVLPTPPSAALALKPHKVRRLHRPLSADLLQQGIQLRALGRSEIAEVVTAFARSALAAQGAYLAQPEKWLKNQQYLGQLSRLSGVSTDQVPELVKGNTYLPVAEQITQLGQPVDQAIRDTAAFLKEQGKIPQVASDYSHFVTDRFVKAVQATPQS